MRDTNVKDRPKHVKVVPEPVEETAPEVEEHQLTLVEAAKLVELTTNLFSSEPESHRVKDVLTSAGQVTKTAAAAVIDLDLRDVGKGIKRLGRGIKNRTPRIKIERPEPASTP